VQYNSWESVSDMQVALQKVVDDEELINILFKKKLTTS
jgi:hypothetical protein